MVVDVVVDEFEWIEMGKNVDPYLRFLGEPEKPGEVTHIHLDERKVLFTVKEFVMGLLVRGPCQEHSPKRSFIHSLFWRCVQS